MMSKHTLTADGSTPAESKSEFISAEVENVIVIATGDFGGGTLTIECSVDGAAWVPTGISMFGGNDVDIFPTHPRLLYRATLSGATAPDVVVSFLA